jgi:glyoxylase-like metal-dependent hydrolase (beta-lactamase superfamily II)/rhodanese-related sulfurtransferase
MLFRQLFDRVSCTYSYLLGDESTGEAVLIDPVFELHERDAALIRELGLKLKYTLDTHVHADHVTGAWLMREKLGSEIVLSSLYGAENVNVGVRQGDAVSFGDHSVQVRETPGHTAGCLTFVLDDHKTAFTGDALLIRGAGRTDFQEGSAHTLFHSIKDQILTLPEACELFPAHDYKGRTVTTVREEMRFNVRLGGEANEEDFVGFMKNLGLAHPKQIDVALPANMVCGKPENAPEEQREWAPIVLNFAGIPEVDPEWVAAHRDTVQILDVRGSVERAREGAIPGSILMPIDEIRAKGESLPKDRPIVTVCRSGMRSGQAAVILRQLGFDRVANVSGGMIEWSELSLPIERTG